jgi:hypothetical protein
VAYDPSDVVTARALFEDAIGMGSTPAFTTAQVDRYFALAETSGTYPAAALNLAAAAAWDAKASITADQYDLGAGGGRELTRSQWHVFCLNRAAAYRSGAASVTGADLSTARVSGSMRLVTRLYEETVP